MYVKRACIAVALVVAAIAPMTQAQVPDQASCPNLTLSGGKPPLTPLPPTPGNFNFCNALDTVYCSLSPLTGFVPEIAQFSSLIQCINADINGALILEGNPEIPVSGNGMLDAQFEMGVIAAILNDTSFELNGLTHAEVLAAFQANYAFFQGLIDQALANASLKSTNQKDLRPLVNVLAPYLVNALSYGLSGYVLIGDEDSLAALNELFLLLSDLGIAPPSTNDLTLVSGFFGAEDDIDGDGCTNRQEYDEFFDALDPSVYVDAALDPLTTPATPCTAEGEGEGQGPGGEFCQQPQAGVFATAVASNNVSQRQAIELVTGITGEVTAVRWWGASTTNILNACDPAQHQYQVGFYQVSGLIPNAPISVETVTPVITNTGETVFNTPLLQFDAELTTPVPVPAEGFWFSVYVPNTQNGCLFSWSESDTGDNASVNFRFDTLSYEPSTADLAFCLFGASGPEGEGALEGEGLFEGTVEGFFEGTVEGTPEGTTEGTVEGTPEGVVEGFVEGTTEGTTEGVVEGEGEGADPCAPGPFHTADTNGNFRIELQELLRVIQFFNSTRFGCVVSPATSVDGYVANGTNESCCPHDSDFAAPGPNFRISLPELLRLIQFFNSGGYQVAPGNAPDNYVPGLVI